MLRPYSVHGVDQKDESFLIGYFDPFQIVARAILAAAGADGPHVNTGLSDDGWKVLLGPGAEAEIKVLATSMGAMLSQSRKEGNDPALKSWGSLTTTVNGLWNMLATVGEVVPLHGDGLESSQVVYPTANPKGGFGFVSKARAWVDIRTKMYPPPLVREVYDVPKPTREWPYAATRKTVTGQYERTGEIADRNAPLAELAERVGRIELAYQLGANARLEMLWGPAIFGPSDERNKQQQAVQLQRVINLRSIGLAYRLQPALFLAHCIREWLFGGPGSLRPVEELLTKTYTKADLDFVRQQLDAVCAPSSEAW